MLPPAGAAPATRCCEPRRPARPRRHATAPACCRSRSRPTAAACARSASCRTPAPAWPPRRPDGKCSDEIAAALGGELDGADPCRRRPDRRPPRRRAPGSAALAKAATVIAFSTWLDRPTARHADVVFPAESDAEKEGTRHPPRRPPAAPAPRVGAPARSRAGWQVLAELAQRARPRPRRADRRAWRPRSWPTAVPFYAGITLDEIGGTRRSLAGARGRGESARAAAPRAVRARSAAGRRAAAERPPAPRRPSARSGRRARSSHRRHAASSCARASASSSRRPTPTRLGVAQRRAASTSAPTAASVSGGRRASATPRPRAPPSCSSRRSATARRAARRARRRARAGRGGQVIPACSTALAGRRRLRRAVVDQIVKSLVDLRRRSCSSCRCCCWSSASCSAASRTATAPTASARSARCSRSPTSSSCSRKESFRPRTSIGWLFTHRAGRSRSSPRSRRSRSSRSANVVDIFGTPVGLYGIDVSIGLLYVFAFGAIAFYGLMLGGWASGSKYSLPRRDARGRAADLLRGRAGPGAASA